MRSLSLSYHHINFSLTLSPTFGIKSLRFNGVNASCVLRYTNDLKTSRISRHSCSLSLALFLVTLVFSPLANAALHYLASLLQPHHALRERRDH